MALFWDDLKVIPDGYRSSYYFSLRGYLQEQRRDFHPLNVEAWQYGRDYYLIPSIPFVPKPGGGVFKGGALVCWLPWQNGSMTKILLSDLNMSGCAYFMTSEFSGCRFVVTNEYVGHVAHWARSSMAETTSYFERSRVRTEVERDYRARNYFPPSPKFYRSISSSNAADSGSDGFGSTDSLFSSYAQDGFSNDRMIVFGYKDPQSLIGWSFKYIKFAANRRTMPIWYTLPIPPAPRTPLSRLRRPSGSKYYYESNV